MYKTLQYAGIPNNYQLIISNSINAQWLLKTGKSCTEKHENISSPSCDGLIEIICNNIN